MSAATVSPIITEPTISEESLKKTRVKKESVSFPLDATQMKVLTVFDTEIAAALKAKDDHIRAIFMKDKKYNGKEYKHLTDRIVVYL